MEESESGLLRALLLRDFASNGNAILFPGKLGCQAGSVRFCLLANNILA